MTSNISPEDVCFLLITPWERVTPQHRNLFVLDKFFMNSSWNPLYLVSTFRTTQETEYSIQDHHRVQSLRYSSSHLLHTRRAHPRWGSIHHPELQYVNEEVLHLTARHGVTAAKKTSNPSGFILPDPTPPLHSDARIAIRMGTILTPPSLPKHAPAARNIITLKPAPPPPPLVQPVGDHRRSLLTTARPEKRKKQLLAENIKNLTPTNSKMTTKEKKLLPTPLPPPLLPTLLTVLPPPKPALLPPPLSTLMPPLLPSPPTTVTPTPSTLLPTQLPTPQKPLQRIPNYATLLYKEEDHQMTDLTHFLWGGFISFFVPYHC